MDKSELIDWYLELELAKRDFWQFCLYYDKPLFESREFLKGVADAMQDVNDGKIKSLSVSMPPRSGKSYITSLFCAWTLGNNPTESVMRNTCTATLYTKFSYDVRDIVRSLEFQQVFPDVKLSSDKANLQGWNTNTSKQVGFFGAGVGGTIIGFGASKVAITDDLYRGIEDALNEHTNDKIIQWKQATHDSRMESGCARIDIGTRWTINDVIGSQFANGEYDKSISIPALDKDDQSFCESVMSTEEYHDKRKKTAKEIWLAEYQQQPIDIKGMLFGDIQRITPDEFEVIRKHKKPDGSPAIDGCIGYVDVSDQGKDFTACAIGAVVNDHIYIVDYVFDKSNTDVTIPMVANLLEKWDVKYCRVESNSMGAMFARELQRNTKTRILQVANTQNKITRIIMQSAFIIQKMTFIQYENPSATGFIDNIISFSKEGKNKNDDAPDCIAGLAMFIQSMFRSIRQ
jgi:predicted phage terminase large subunit-like protein